MDDRVFQVTYRFAQQIGEGLSLSEVRRRWSGIRKIVKRYKFLESPKRAEQLYEIGSAVFKIESLEDLSAAIEYYSDRWCRGRLWTIDRAIRKLMENAAEEAYKKFVGVIESPTPTEQLDSVNRTSEYREG